MKFFVVVSILVAAAAAAPAEPKFLGAVASHVQAIIAAIQNPTTDSATAHLLEHILEHIAAALPEPVAVGPAIVETPVLEEPAQPVQPSPVVFGPITPGSPVPLVQILVNINSNPLVPVAPVVQPSFHPVQVVEEAVNLDPVGPVVEPVEVIEAAPVPVEPVIIGTPVIPSPVVTLPEELN